MLNKKKKKVEAINIGKNTNPVSLQRELHKTIDKV